MDRKQRRKERRENKKGFFCEFREFALRGNMFDLAVGVIIGGAFSRIVNAMVDSIFMPILSLIIGGVDISEWAIPLPMLWGRNSVSEELYEEAYIAAAETIYLPAGVFLQAIIEFIFIAFCLFLIIKVINKLRAAPPAEPPPPPAPSKSEELLTEIRDILRKD